MVKLILRFGLLATALLFLIQLSQYSLFTFYLDNEIRILIFALLFLGFGVLIGQIYFNQKKTPLTESPQPQVINHQKIKELGISKREYEVLELIAKGYSNHEIASQLFISESTVKTHVSNLLTKLEAKRRTQALTIAKQINIIE